MKTRSKSDHDQDKQELEANPTACDAVGIQITTLQRSLGLSNVVALMLSATGHVAIFITPSIIVRLSGSLISCMVLWCLGSLGVYTMALCFTEMATIFQKAGGPYLYVTETLGKLPGFLIGYGYIALISGPFLAFLSQTAALYIITAIVMDADCDSGHFKTVKQILAGWILLTLTYLNCSFFKVLVKVQSFLTLMRIVAIAIIILSGLYFTFTRPFASQCSDWDALAASRILAVSLVRSSLCYAIDLRPCRRNELASVTKDTGGAHVVKQSVLVSASEVMRYDKATRKGAMPSVLNTLDPTHNTPMMAVIALAIYGLILIYSGGTEAMMEFIGLFSYIMSLNVVSALLYLRYTRPSLVRPYRVPTFLAVLQLFLGIFLLIFIVYQRPMHMSIGIAIYLSGIPVYIFLVKWSEKPKVFSTVDRKFTES
ncbi:Y+L amino acid transporter 2 [Elysia marginata]|uniref:Y+L amino acid transporter 2 n=1 Tax=Elysia marginata TaxID=1093978 RepID=A0AAV4JRS6_9GAST|nr:Y+L amino acid transporter 2 [Elysia marginata]